MNSTSTALNSFQSSQPAFPVSATDKLGVILYSYTDSAVSKKITLYYGGSTHASSFTSPYSKRHNDLSGIQGGLTAERYHLSLDKYNVVQNTTNTNTGDQTNISGNASTATDADKLDGQHGTFYASNTNLVLHTSNIANPHAVTKLQVGLGAVTNESKATMFTSPTFTGATASANTFTSTVASGSAPFVVTSNTVVTNLNADLLDGQHGSFYSANSIVASHTSNVSNPHVTTATQLGLGAVTNESKATMFTSPTFTGATTSANTFTSTVATGSAPFVVTSNTLVTNLNADLLDGQHGSFYSANSIVASHTSNIANPHAVTKLQVGLGNVTDESKATMFSSPTFTGNTTIPTILGGSAVTDKLVLQGTSGNGTLTSPAVQVNVGNAGATTALTVLNNGNVGIGTSTPSQKLEVDGSIALSSTGGQTLITSGTSLTLSQTGDVYGATSLTLKSRNGVNGALFSSAGLDLVDFGFKPMIGPQCNIRLEHRSASFTLSGNEIGEWQFINDSTANPTVYPFRSGLGTTSISGNVGIGTTNPTAKLQIQGAGTTTGITLQTQDSTGAALLKQLDSGITSLTPSNSSALTDLTINPTTKTSGNLIDLQVTGASKFKVDYAGAVTLTSSASTTLVTNLNADYLDGQHSTYYAPTASPAFSGSSTFSGTVAIKASKIDTLVTALSTTVQTSVYSFMSLAYRTGKFLVQVVDTSTSQIHSTEILLIHDSTNVLLVEYGTVFTSAAKLGTFTASITSGELNLLFTATDATAKIVNVYGTLLNSEFTPYGATWNESTDAYTII